jgi:two-component system nitrate/nitrite response regulator NarL
MPGQPPRSDGPLRVLVVDSDDRTRESLAGLLAIGDQVVVVGSAGQVEPALDLAVEEHPDVVIVDPRLPEVDGGIAFMTRLRQLAPTVRIVAMSWSENLAEAVLSGGADGFVRKTYRPTELVAAIVAATGRQPG